MDDGTVDAGLSFAHSPKAGRSAPLDNGRPAKVPPAAQATARRPGARPAPLAFIETSMEKLLFASRWILAPLYVGLVGGMIVVVIKFAQSFWNLIENAVHDDLRQVTLALLELLDITLLGNLVLIVVFAGYETFVSKIGAAEGSEDRPHWMGRVDYSGLKIKLVGSIVAISVIGLLQDFLHVGPTNTHVEAWRVGIHVTFLFSGVLFAVMDLLAEKRAKMTEEREFISEEHQLVEDERELVAEQLELVEDEEALVRLEPGVNGGGPSAK